MFMEEPLVRLCVGKQEAALLRLVKRYLTFHCGKVFYRSWKSRGESLSGSTYLHTLASRKKEEEKQVGKPTFSTEYIAY